MGGGQKQRLCRICKKRPPWKYKNCPPDVCKRCYHKHLWSERPAARNRNPDVTNGPEDLPLSDQ